MGFLERAKEVFKEIVEERNLLEESVLISFRPLKPEEAIGNPGRDDFPIIAGKERVIEASFRGKRAHVFTDSPADYEGEIGDILKMEITSNRERAILIGAINCVLKYLGIIEKTIHCKDEEPVKCGDLIAEFVKGRGAEKVGLIGLNPSILEGLSKVFGEKNLRVTDLNPENIGKLKQGVRIWDGNEMTERLISESDFILVTGTTFVNGTADLIMELIKRYRKDYSIYGVTARGIAKLLNLPEICPYGRQ